VSARGEPAAEKPKSRGRLVLRRETKHRGGKAVVVVAGLRANAHLAESEIATLAQHLKQQLGCGGSVERVASDTEIVVQGDQPARVAELLRARGFRVDGVTS
jgi:translation initiation factor 1 (eIF-1/SUI1)